MANITLVEPLPESLQGKSRRQTPKELIVMVTPAQFQAKSEYPQLFATDIPALSESIGQLTRFLRPIEETATLQIQCFDKNSVELYDSGFIQVQFVERGSHITKLQTELPSASAKIHLSFDEPNNKLSLNVSYVGNTRDVIVLDQFNQILRAFTSARHIRITNANLHTVSLLNEPSSSNVSERERYTDRMVHALAVIAEKTGLSLTMPEKLSVNDVLYAEEIANILQSGVAHQRLDIPENSVIGANARLEDAIGFMQLHDEGKDFTIKTPGREQFAEIQGYTLELGETLYEFQNLKVHNYDELKALIDRGETGDTPVKIFFAFDLEHVKTLFKKWAPPELLQTTWLDMNRTTTDTALDSSIPEQRGQPDTLSDRMRVDAALADLLVRFEPDPSDGDMDEAALFAEIDVAMKGKPSLSDAIIEERREGP
jgi:hypothetical protein